MSAMTIRPSNFSQIVNDLDINFQGQTNIIHCPCKCTTTPIFRNAIFARPVVSRQEVYGCRPTSKSSIFFTLILKVKLLEFHSFCSFPKMVEYENAILGARLQVDKVHDNVKFHRNYKSVLDRRLWKSLVCYNSKPVWHGSINFSVNVMSTNELM